MGLSEKSSAQAEPEILRLVVELDRDRILSIAKKISKKEFQDFFQKTRSSGPLVNQVKKETQANPEFKPWLDECPYLSEEGWSSSSTRIKLIDWASKARWAYGKQFKSFLKVLGLAEPPDWLESLHKMARYHSAIKSMIKLAAKQPNLFANIQIKDLEAPSSSRFSMGRFNTSEAIKDLVGNEGGAIMDKLEERLGTHDLERRWRKACPSELTLHGEMQLIVFYEGNPSLVPLTRLMGTSKKACFFCHQYLLQHPLGLQVSACHQKIYPTWMPPPYYPVGRQFKSPQFVKLDNDIRRLAVQELKTALNKPQRPNNKDSTAGPSLTMTATAPTKVGSVKAARAG